MAIRMGIRDRQAVKLTQYVIRQYSRHAVRARVQDDFHLVFALTRCNRGTHADEIVLVDLNLAIIRIKRIRQHGQISRPIIVDPHESPHAAPPAIHRCVHGVHIVDAGTNLANNANDRRVQRKLLRYAAGLCITPAAVRRATEG